MFRAYSYLTIGDNTHRVHSVGVNDRAEVERLFDELATRLGNGGGVEQHVPGIGWVLADDVESVQIVARMRASDQEVEPTYHEPVPNQLD